MQKNIQRQRSNKEHAVRALQAAEQARKSAERAQTPTCTQRVRTLESAAVERHVDLLFPAHGFRMNYTVTNAQDNNKSEAASETDVEIVQKAMSSARQTIRHITCHT
jgi:hypothetical protein